MTERVEDQDTDPATEVGQVGLALNDLLDPLLTAPTSRHRSEQRVRQLVADASHELRTPLASIRGHAELSRRQTDPVPEQVRLTRVVIDARVAGPDHRWQMTLPQEPVIVTGDRARLQQVVANLLSNARTHTPSAILVQLRFASGAGRVVLEVDEDGPGMPPELADLVFERFSRGDDSRSRAVGSTQKGATFVMSLPDPPTLVG